MKPTPFKIQIPQAALEDLRERLGRTRWPDEISGAGWSYGANLSYMRELVDYWQTRFDWRAQERALNAFAQFRLNVRGIGVHFIHERGKGPKPLPLVLTHGWPGSFVEMLKVIPLLTDPARFGGDAADCFDTIVPSIPGYGFSDRPTQRGMNTFEIAGLWKDLMGAIGHERFALQGGDFGAGISSWLSLLYPSNVIGLHLNYIPGSYTPFVDSETGPLTEVEEAFLESQNRWEETEGAYGHQQATKPETLSYGLNDSPAGLAAWIVEKFRDWSDCDGDVERRFSKDELLTNISIYWFTETVHSAARLYYEGQQRPLHLKKGERIEAPCGIAKFEKEEPFPPREWIERGYDIQHWTEFSRGGHFASMEEPELLVEDIRAFFRPFRSH